MPDDPPLFSSVHGRSPRYNLTIRLETQDGAYSVAVTTPRVERKNIATLPGIGDVLSVLECCIPPDYIARPPKQRTARKARKARKGPKE